ncbi:S-methyl-5'-thioadenosine phosphorylase [Thermofilum pendens]|uniref:S-methyl-5'-thioadenosine phosphorylase n=1 Tax=Thermofilum pendens (strain DSM 2475 / Hrk 5) TaxID=368408 RepID=MTAP_THEPD|nr:S-methyl-5'-thioadenosine phosphorylase [Thermofilum pendens]A1RXU2.1 RecName: Full=S-methyl-5'-thioadenosine phosphorylase; AltName: Full=5'-methylthioadenosine phosphorylase; Short=MTA phosphorylase; Short=MTAP [Thermofilum pendens Hrk 5]ABL78022.1 methylthioadenosine phosphorylase [Thermofilum pendens Hrk 5]
MEKVKIGIIGGSGLYSPDFLTNPKEEKIYTPYGPPSSHVVIGEIAGRKVAFIPRHGKRHEIPPHKVNYRANIYALKELGVERLISVSAVGSLREDYKPGDFVCTDQFIDMTKGRVYTFYDGPVVAHVSMADPFCPELRELCIRSARKLGITMHEKGTYICIEGPRFSTRAESRLWRQFGADIIGMTLVPEVNLAREARMCFLNIAMVTDYDVWAEKPVTAHEVARVMAENTEKVKRLLADLIPSIPEERKCQCARALDEALI